MKIFRKIFKVFFILVLLFSVLLLISIYISSLNSYKESDFNIPKDAFQTKFWDKDPNSIDNGFDDYVEFIEILGKYDFSYFEIMSKCIFDKEYIKKGRCDIDRQNYFEKLSKTFILDYLEKSGFKQSEVDMYVRSISDKIEKSEDYKIINFSDFTNIYPDTNIPEDILEKYFKGLDYFKTNKEKLIEIKYKKFKDFVHKNIESYDKINEKEYILLKDEYSEAYNGNNKYGTGKDLLYNSIIQYTKSIKYIAFKDFENGDYDKGIDLILKHQIFIDNLMNKTDLPLINVLVNLTNSKNNLEAIEYFLVNYELSGKSKNKIKIVLEKEIEKGLVVNALKKEHIINKTVFQYLYDTSFDKENYIYKGNIFSYLKGSIEAYLFFSVQETELISDIKAYDIINNYGIKSDFDCSINLNNYIGRSLVCGTEITYKNQYDKEKDLIKFRQGLIDKIGKISIKKEESKLENNTELLESSEEISKTDDSIKEENNNKIYINKTKGFAFYYPNTWHIKNLAISNLDYMTVDSHILAIYTNGYPAQDFDGRIGVYNDFLENILINDSYIKYAYDNYGIKKEIINGNEWNIIGDYYLLENNGKVFSISIDKNKSDIILKTFVFR